MLKAEFLRSRIISIHAPPRGATRTADRIWKIIWMISIHAPPRGATRTSSSAERAWRISIHAPPRGATGGTKKPPTERGKFQFTPLREGRPLPSYHSEASKTFQFTPLREGRQGALYRSFFVFKFQFTPLREGRLCSLSALSIEGTISIHAPPRGATSMIFCCCSISFISIHAPPRGATRA